MPEQRRSRLLRHAGFALSLALGLGFSACIYLFLAISECLPRDGSAQMVACDAIKRRDAWLYPVLLAASVTVVLALHIRRARHTWLLALAPGLLAAIVLMVINALTG